MEYLMTFLIWCLNHFWIVSLAIIVLVGLYVLVTRLPGQLKDEKKKFPYHILPILLILTSLSLFLSRYATVPLIYHLGLEAEGQVVAVERTNSLYNEQYVYRHLVLFKDQEGNTIETSFKTSDFNVYPLSNEVSYPSRGQRFTLRYLEHAPDEFVIVRDELKHSLNELYKKRSEVESKLEFDPDNLEYQESLDAILAEIQMINEEQRANELSLYLSDEFEVENVVLEIDDIDSVEVNPDESQLFVIARYSDLNSNSGNGLFILDLETKVVESMYPMNHFDRHLAVHEGIQYYTDIDEQLLLNDLATYESISFDDKFDIPFNLRRPVIFNHYLFESRPTSSTGQALDLETGELFPILQDTVDYFYDWADWSILTEAQQLDRLHQIFELEDVTDFRLYFTEILEDESRHLDHSAANSGLFFSEGDDEVSTVLYHKLDDILFYNGHQSLLREALSDYKQKQTVALEDDGTVYAIAMENSILYVAKMSPTTDLEIVETAYRIDSLNFHSLHLTDRIILINETDIIDIDKADLTVEIRPLIK